MCPRQHRLRRAILVDYQNDDFVGVVGGSGGQGITATPNGGEKSFPPWKDSGTSIYGATSRISVRIEQIGCLLSEEVPLQTQASPAGLECKDHAEAM